MPAKWELCDSALAPAHSVRKYILTGYRPLLTDARSILASLFYLHNESGNIYTHAIALVIFAALAYRHFVILDLPMQIADILFCSLFFAGVMTCYSLSVYYHLYCCAPYAAYQYAFACDLVGIVACILGSFYIGLWFGFECYPRVRLMYMTVITLLSVPLLYITAKPSLRHNRQLVIPLYSAVVAFGLVPTLHWTLVVDHPARGTLMRGIYGMFLLYLIGVVLYICHVPECWLPGSFDFVGSSHQLWHICVFLAPFVEYIAATEAASRGGACHLIPA